jgi:hypothetical protein
LAPTDKEDQLMNRTRVRNAATAVAATASIAAVVGIATGAAAPSQKEKGSSSSGAVVQPFPGPPGGPPRGTITFRAGHGPKGHPPLPFGGPPVHSEMVVPTKSGNDFETITQDSGKLQSVSGSQVTITEGTEQATYKTVTLDIPTDAKVIRNGKSAGLSDLQQGDQVHVSQSPQNSFVFAADSTFTKKLGNRPLPPPPGVGGLPPGLPPAPMGRRGH